MLRRREWLAGLFPAAPTCVITPITVGVSLLAVVLGTVIGLARQPGPGALRTLYAEDGSIYLTQGLHLSFLDALKRPYAGYVQIAPRLMGELASAFPVRDAAVVLSGGGALVVSALALLLFRATSGHIGSLVIRIFVGASLIFLPVAQAELLNTGVNLGWYLMPMAFWLLLWRPTSSWEIAIGAIVVALAPLTDPLSAAMIPLALLRVLALTNRRDWVVPGAFVAGLIAQLSLSWAGNAHRTYHSTANVGRDASWYAYAVVGRTWFGSRLLGGQHAARGILLSLVAVLLTVLITYWIWRFGDLHARLFWATTLVSSGLLFALPTLRSGLDPPRYAVPAILVLFGGVAVFLDRTAAFATDRRWRIGRVVVAVLVLAVWSADFRVDTPRSRSVQWRPELAAAVARCDQGGLSSVTIPTAPPGWTAVFYCSDLRGSPQPAGAAASPGWRPIVASARG
jgi:hypothetical protein